MPEPNQDHSTLEEVPAHPREDHGDGNVLDFSGQLAVWTWITFFLATFLLYKYAWKPILTALDKREEGIQKSLDDAERIQAELTQLDDKKKEVLQEANNQAKEIVAGARKGATEAARVIENKAKEEAQIMLTNARREISAETNKARAVLRKESSELAVNLAGKIIGENLDDERNRKLTQKFIEEL